MRILTSFFLRIAETGAEGTERRDEEERDTENDQKEKEVNRP